MITLMDAAQCPECGAAGAVSRGFCAVCSTEIEPDEGPRIPSVTPPVLHPSIPLRFADVIDELRTIASMASEARLLQGASVAAACRRAESLLLVLRRQFVEDVTTDSLAVEGRGRRSDGARMFTARSSSGRGRFTSLG